MYIYVFIYIYKQVYIYICVYVSIYKYAHTDTYIPFPLTVYEDFGSLTEFYGSVRRET